MPAKDRRSPAPSAAAPKPPATDPVDYRSLIDARAAEAGGVAALADFLGTSREQLYRVGDGTRRPNATLAARLREPVPESARRPPAASGRPRSIPDEAIEAAVRRCYGRHAIEGLPRPSIEQLRAEGGVGDHRRYGLARDAMEARGELPELARRPSPPATPAPAPRPKSRPASRDCNPQSTARVPRPAGRDAGPCGEAIREARAAMERIGLAHHLWRPRASKGA